MAECGQCGATDQSGRFCTNCGTAIAGPRVDLSKQPRSAEPAPPTVITPSVPNWAPTASSPLPPPTAPQPTPPGRDPRRSHGAAALVALAVAVLLLAGVGVWFMLRPTGGEGVGAVAGKAAPATDPLSSARTAAPPAGGGTKPAPIAPPGSKGEPSSSSAAATTAVTTVATTTVSQDPMGGPRVDIACGSGYIVQVASELDQPAFAARVATLRAAGQLPADVKWTETSTSCPIFTNQVNVLVLYAGPFASVADACPARLAGPGDAFVKAADPAAVGTFRSCLCPASPAGLPPITTVGQQGQWVGELQHVLGTGLDYNVGNINADPSIGDPGRWGVYTADTAAALGRFQADHGLPATRQVDPVTWSALQAARCGHE